jgi:tRNA dimethylallyltransferase
VYIAGPTAVGKSAVALHLAELLHGEIISVDSMQVYRGMDVGTAKPSPAERARVRHHLIDIVPVAQPFDAATFVQRAKEAARDIEQRGARPIFCGGTGLYFQAFWHGLGEAPASDPNLRSELQQRELHALLEELQRLDPETFLRIDRANRRRVVRALEVVRLTGESYLQQQARWRRAGESANDGPKLAFGLRCPREMLNRRIDRRVDHMFAQGLIGEVEQLVWERLRANPTALQALGYRQVVEYLDGARSLPETIALVKQKTRQYAKRQMTWFLHQAQLTWVDLADLDRAPQIAAQLASLCR